MYRNGKFEDECQDVGEVGRVRIACGVRRAVCGEPYGLLVVIGAATGGIWGETV